ncbi:MAG TPA: hypothetical protein VGC65_08525 [Bacteroidia bacterium]|jgi:hypothetical protein
MRKGYRNSDNDFNIESEVEQFNFNKNHIHLKVNIDWTIKDKLAPVERVDFYLKDKRLIKNIFMVNGELAYYYEFDEYYPEDPREEPPVPSKNICKKFEFEIDDILLIRANNEPTKPLFDLGHIIRIDWLFLHKPNPLDTKKSIEQNIFVQIEQWSDLPKQSDNDIYRNEVV